MKYTTLGNTDIHVSKICLGTMTFGEQNTEREAHDQINYAISRGVNFLDTAEMYSVPARAETQGRSEEIIGAWNAKHKDIRYDVVIATKAAGPNPNFDWLRGGPNFSKKHLTEAINASLRRLRTDYVDLYQLHWPERKTNFFGKLGYKHESDDTGHSFHEVLETLSGFVKQGKVLHIGLSNETPWGVMKFLEIARQHNLEKVVSIQNPYSLLNRSFEVGLAEIAMREKVGLLAYSPLGFGYLTGKYAGGGVPANSRMSLFPQMARYSGEQSMKAASLYNQLAKDNNMTPAQMALAFVNQQDFVTSTIIGATTREQLKENLSSAEITLTSELLEEINNIHQVFANPAP